MAAKMDLTLGGVVVRGYGRGSKELGCPTANLHSKEIDLIGVDNGIYFGYGRVDNGPFYPMVSSVGVNPFYNNQQKTVEVHLLHVFDKDFYGSTVTIQIKGYLRPERNFATKADLIDAIQSDIRQTRQLLNVE